MKSALLIIDVQEGVFSPFPQPYKMLAVINKINQLIAQARQNKIPIIFIQHEDNQQLRYLSDEWQLYQTLDSSVNDLYVRKTTPDSFLHTNLLDLLQQLNIEQCVICGYASEFCVDATTRRAASLKFPVILVEDAHTTHDKQHLDAQNIIKHHNSTLMSMTSFGVTIRAMLTHDIDFNEIR